LAADTGGAITGPALTAPKDSQHMPDLTIVMPVRNAAGALLGSLAGLRAARRAGWVGQILLADGGSTDGTAWIAAAQGAHLIDCPPGRGRQLAAGAAVAAGEWLLFLHADTRLAPGWERAVAAFMDRPDAKETAAVFRLAFDELSPAARRTAALANWRTRRLGLPYGDQGLLIHRALYNAVGGFPQVPLMEDVAMARRLGPGRLGSGRIVLLNATATTSASKYRRDGWWWRSARNLGILSLYFLGVPPTTLRRLYG
jgi:rSAM/selenodomain-associated transferase 2